MKHPIEHPVVDEMIKLNFSFEVYGDHIYISDGFSKAGGCKLFLPPADYPVGEFIAPLIAHMRYDETEEIHSFDDLIDLSWKWWRRYADRGYSCPIRFKPFFLEKGWVQMEMAEVLKVVAR